MSLNVIKAILILNAKKGWTDAARKKAALTRKAKSNAGALRFKKGFGDFKGKATEGTVIKQLAKANAKLKGSPRSKSADALKSDMYSQIKRKESNAAFLKAITKKTKKRLQF